MMEDRRTGPTTRYAIPEQRAEELVAAGAEPAGSEEEPKEIINVVGAAEEEAGDKRVENWDLVSLGCYILGVQLPNM